MAPPVTMDWEGEKLMTIARCMEEYITPDKEEEMMPKLFRAQTRAEKRRWLAQRVGRTDAYGEWYASEPFDHLDIVFSNEDKEEARRLRDERKVWATFVGNVRAPKDHSRALRTTG